MFFNNENEIDETVIDNLFFEEIEQIENIYSRSNLIINPISIQKCLNLQTVIKELSELSYFQDMEISQSIDKQFGWSYIVTLKSLLFGFAGNDMQLFKNAIVNSDTIDITDYTIDGKIVGTQITLAVDNLYIPVQ